MSAPALAAAARGVTILDLDRTLTRHGTYSPFLLHAALRTAPYRLLLVPVAIAGMLAYRAGLIGRETLKRLMQRSMMGRRMPRARVAALADAFACRIVRRGLHADAAALIARERAEGRMLILATAAHRFYADAIARRLGIDHVVATESDWRGDLLAPAIVEGNCYGPRKASALLSYLGALGLSRRDLHLRCYSDDVSDLPCFDLSDECRVVNPSRTLARIAARRGWPILRWR